MARTNPDGESYKNIAYILFGLLILAAFGSFSAIRFAEDDYNRDARYWETTLNTAANTRADAVEKWLKEQSDTIEGIADNLSIKLYITEMGIEGNGVGEPSQITFMRNYLIETANRSGFSSFFANRKVRANVRPEGSNGIVMLDKQKRIIVATDSMPEITGELKEFVDSNIGSKTRVKDIYLNSSGEPVMAFLTPIFSVQGGESEKDIIGAVLGVRTVEESLFPLLGYPKSANETEESILVREKGVVVVEYISPLRDGTKSTELKLNLDDPQFSAKFVIDNPEAFAVKKDYLSNNVLVTGRKISNSPWYLIHKIDYSESLAESDERRNTIIVIFLLVIALILFFVIAVWRHGASVRVARESLRYKHLFEQYKSLEKLLRLVADNQPDAIFITDKEGNYLFVNAEVAHSVGMNNSDIIGKRMKDVFGTDKAHGYEENNKSALKSKRIISAEKRVDDKVVQLKHVPLKKIPVILTGEEKPGVLVVEQDITSAVSEREKRERILDQVINTLVTVVDRRDSFSAKHSERVAEVSKVIAENMGIEKIYVETAHASGRLMNLGKIELEPKLLTKKEKLTKEEKKKVENSILTSAELIKEVEFKGPVVKTLEQSQEHWDGSGPLGLKGSKILITARIIAVANAFVAMTSPRAYRPKMKQEAIIKTLLEEAGKKYERRVVVALISHLENNKDLFKWNK